MAKVEVAGATSIKIRIKKEIEMAGLKYGLTINAHKMKVMTIGGQIDISG